MKWSMHPALFLNGLVAFYYYYNAALHGLANLLNISNGKNDFKLN